MIITETVSINGRTLTHTYSDSGYMIKQDSTGIVYSEAYDPIDSGRTYTETDELIEADTAEDADVESMKTEIQTLREELNEAKTVNNILLGVD